MEQNILDQILKRLPTKIEAVNEETNEVFFLTLRRVFLSETWIAGYESFKGKIFTEVEHHDYIEALLMLENAVSQALDYDATYCAIKKE